jgi:hypothetical protein
MAKVVNGWVWLYAVVANTVDLDNHQSYVCRIKTEGAQILGTI